MANADGFLPPRRTEPPDPPPPSSGRRPGQDNEMVAAIRIHANAIYTMAEAIAELTKALRGDDSK